MSTPPISLDFSEDGGTLYLFDSRGRDKAALAAIDMTTREATVLAADDEADIVRRQFIKRRPVAAMAMAARARWRPVEPGFAKDLTALAAYGAGDASISRGSKRRGRRGWSISSATRQAASTR